MNTNMKNFLLAGTALMAATFALSNEASAQQTINAGTTAIITPTTGVVTLADPGSIGTVANGATVSHNIVAAAPGNGALLTLGNATVGSVGTSGTPIGTIDINGGNGTTALFNGGGTYANFMTFTGSAGATVTLSSATTITNAIALGANTINVTTGQTFTPTGGITGGTGTIGLDDTAILAGGTADIATLNKTGAGTGAVSSILTAGAVNVNGGTLNISNAGSAISGTTALGANALQFAGSSMAAVTGTGTLSLTGSAQSAGAIAATTLNLNGSGTKTLGGAVNTTNANIIGGVDTAGAGVITTTNLAKTGAGNSTIGNQVNATNTYVSGGSTLTANTAGTTLGTVTFDTDGGTVNGLGITSVVGAATLTAVGTVSSQLTNATVTNNATSTNGIINIFNADSTLNTVTLGNTNSIVQFYGTAINGAVTGAGNIGTLTLEKAGAQTVHAVTAKGLSLKGSGTKTLDGAINVTNFNIEGGVSANGTGAITATNLVKTGAGDSVIGNVVTATNTGIVGGGKLELTASGSNAGVVNFGAGGGTLELGGGVNTGDIGVSAGQTGNVTFLGASTVGGNVGVAEAVNTVTVRTNNGAAIAFNGTTNMQNLVFDDVTGVGNVTLNGATNTIANAIDFKTGTLTLGNNATLAVANGGVTGTTLVLDGGTNGVTTQAASTSTITTLTKNNAGAATFGGGNLAVTTVNVNGGSLAINGSGSTITGVSTIGANTLTFAGTSMASVAGAGGTLNLTGTGAQAVTGAVGSAGNALTKVAVNGTGTKTFGNADFHATTLEFGAAGTADLTAATTVGAQTITFGTNNGTVNFANGITYTGSATNGGTGNGNLNFGNGSTIGAAATIGSVGNKLNSLTFGTGTNTIDAAIHAGTTNIGAGTLTSTNTTFDSAINFTGDGTVTLAANTANIGAVTTAGAGTGTLVFSGGPLTIGGQLQQLKEFNLTQNLTVNGNATAANAMNIAGNEATVNGTFTTTADSNMIFNVKSATTNGKVTATGEATVHADTAVTVNVDTTDYIAQGQEFTLIDGAESGGHVADLTAGKLTTTNTALLHFRQKVADDNNLVVYADRTQMSTAATLPNNQAVGTMLDALGAGGDADVDALQIRLANYTTETDVENVLATLVPDVSGGTVAAVTSVGGTTSTVVNNRLASLRDAGDYETGMVAGDAFQNYHFWGQAFGSSANQGFRDRVAGYDANSYGLVVGADSDITDSFRAGLAFAYGDTDVDGKDANRTDTEIDSYQISLYGNLDLQDNIFLTGQIAYMYSDIDTARHDVGGILGNTARADFDSDQYIARAELGRKFAIDQRFSLTPSALVNYNHIDISNYTETGAGGLGLRNVDTDEMDIFELGANLIGEATFDDLNGGFIKPNIHAGYRHDLIGDSVATSAGLVGGGAAFRTNGFDPAEGTANVGAGIKWQLQNNLEFTANYDYEYKSDYSAHSGFVRAGYKF